MAVWLGRELSWFCRRKEVPLLQPRVILRLTCQVVETVSVSKMLWFGKTRGRRETLAKAAASGNFVRTVGMLNTAALWEETRCLQERNKSPYRHTASYQRRRSFLTRWIRLNRWPTCMTLMGRPVSFASCSRMCLVGFGVCEKAVFRISSCLALIVVRGPRLFDPELPSSGDLFSVCESRVSGSPSSDPAR